jgi:hypothetical protein
MHHACSGRPDYHRAKMPSSPRLVLSALALVAASASACKRGPPAPQHRERFAARDADCRAPARPVAFLYPAENRTDYGPDDPKKDGCELAVPDHLFCCPNAPRPSDR